MAPVWIRGLTGNVCNKSFTHFCPWAYIEYNLLTLYKPNVSRVNFSKSFLNPPHDINNSHWATIMWKFKLKLTEGLTAYNTKPLFPALAPTANWYSNKHSWTNTDRKSVAHCPCCPQTAAQQKNVPIKTMRDVETTFSGCRFRGAKSKFMLPYYGTVFLPPQCLFEVSILLKTAEGVTCRRCQSGTTVLNTEPVNTETSLFIWTNICPCIKTKHATLCVAHEALYY